MGFSGELIGRLRSKNYPAIRDLAQDIARILSAEQQRAFGRGRVTPGVVSGLQGSTRLEVGDNSAARDSVSLQMPARPPETRGPLTTRADGRAEIERKTLPGIVVSSVNAGSSIQLTVIVPLGGTPKLSIDPSTNQNTARTGAFSTLNALAEAARTGSLTPSQLTSSFTITVPRPPAVSGHQPSYVNGQIIDVTKATQYERRTTWVNLDGKRMPIDTSREASTSYTLNTLPQCCVDSGGGGGGS
jgi:hypothetical protein